MAPQIRRSVIGAHERAFSCTVMMMGLSVAVVGLILISISGYSVEANPVVGLPQQQSTFNSNSRSSVAGVQGIPGSSQNNYDNLISDFLDDAGNRLKKFKLNSMRQIKPTLRFGRRSDPLMTPALVDQLAALEGQDQYESSQRRLLAAALAAAGED